MDLEITDELVTPGCPQCAIKHLSTALSILASLKDPVVSKGDERYCRGTASVPFEAGVLLAQAYINFIEAAEGYASHFNHAVGLLNRTEEELIGSCLSCTVEARMVRSVRVGALAYGDPTGTAAAVRALGYFGLSHEAFAHAREACRELPEFPWEETRAQVGPIPPHEFYQHCISAIRKEYFETPELPEKGGDDTMACAKKAKPVAKATKAACKGGKCAAKKGCKK